MISKPIRLSIDVFFLFQGLEKKCAAIGDIEFKSPNTTGLWLNINASHIAVGWVNYEGIRQSRIKMMRRLAILERSETAKRCESLLNLLLAIFITTLLER